MSKVEIIKTVSRTFHRLGFALRKHSPEILVFGGAVGVVAGTVMACKATTKVKDVVEDSKSKIDAINEYAKRPEIINAGEYTETDRKKDITIMYAKTGLELAKIYAPAVIVEAVSLGCMLKSHNILRKRNVALAAAYATVDKSFKDYRGRVIERFGQELDKELKYNIKTKEVEEIVVDENGEEKAVKKTVKTINAYQPSEYAFFFDETCAGWTKSPEANKTFLIQVQNWANEKLQKQGHLFLNELLDMIGVDRTRAGNEVGWMYDKDGIVCGDNYIDLGVFDQCGVERYDERKRAFVNGHERSILIDPNVDGPILAMFP